jgi:SAM-dependent methyltransferase
MLDRLGGLPRLGILSRREPYSMLAGLYDHIMDHVNYRTWAEYVSSLLDRFHPGGGRVLELACGTGSLAVILSSFGYELTCMDQSPDMLRIAGGKFRTAGLVPRIAAGTMTALPFASLFDAVICIYDSINYLMEPSDFARALSEAASVTKEGGLFIFDVCTVKNSEVFFRDATMREEYDGLEYERICRYHPVARIQENRFVIRRNGKVLGTESHRQRIYCLDEIAGMIADSPYKEIGRFDDMSDRPGTELSERVHFVLKKSDKVTK